MSVWVQRAHTARGSPLCTGDLWCHQMSADQQNVEGMMRALLSPGCESWGQVLSACAAPARDRPKAAV